MLDRLSVRSYSSPLAAYVVVIAIITLFVRFLPSDYAFALSGALMLGAPFIMRSDLEGLRWNLRGVLIGIAASIVILSLYVLVVGKPLQWNRISLSLIALHLFLVSIPEEIFFRGYLQEKIGNNLRGVLIVSFLFAVAHVVTRCLGSGCGGAGYVFALLTFFPSIAMGYLYIVSKTLWANIIFHFLANIVYMATGGL